MQIERRIIEWKYYKYSICVYTYSWMIAGKYYSLYLDELINWVILVLIYIHIYTYISLNRQSIESVIQSWTTYTIFASASTLRLPSIIQLPYVLLTK